MGAILVLHPLVRVEGSVTNMLTSFIIAITKLTSGARNAHSNIIRMEDRESHLESFPFIIELDILGAGGTLYSFVLDLGKESKFSKSIHSVFDDGLWAIVDVFVLEVRICGNQWLLCFPDMILVPFEL